MSPISLRNLPLGQLRLALLMIALFLLLLPASAQSQGRGPIQLVALDDVVSRHTVGYLSRALREAEAAGAELLLIRLGTGAAVLNDVQAVAGELAEASVPVVVYVAPEGTSSGAAGLWLLSAAHVAALAPETSFGVPRPLLVPDPSLSPQTQELLRAELIDQLGGLARERGRSDAWVEQAVRQGAVLSNEQAMALEPPAVDLVARDLDELLTGLEGRLVTLDDGQQRTLATLGRAPQPVPPTLWEQLLMLLANPTVAFMLLIMAGIALYAELVTPTVGVLAGIGIALLAGALVGLVALPVRWLAVIGLALAFAVIAADLYVPSHGAFTVVGLVLLVVSAIALFDSAQAPGVSVAFWAIGVVVAAVGGFAALGIYMAVRSRSAPVSTGQESMVGRLAEVRSRLDPEGFVFVEGALWRAVSEDGAVEPGEYVRVTGVYALRLTVRRLEPVSE
jgi:membrane-bound serine protease (ClpP class)